MSEENVEIVRRFYPGRSVDMVATIADRDTFEAVRVAWEPLVDCDFETVVAGQVPLAGSAEIPGGSARPVAHGLDGFASAFRDWLSAWESWVVAPPEFIDVDENRVLALMEIRGRSKTHQVEMPIEAANLWTLRDRKVARLELFLDQAEALEAAGLRD